MIPESIENSGGDNGEILAKCLNGGRALVDSRSGYGSTANALIFTIGLAVIDFRPD